MRYPHLHQRPARHATGQANGQAMQIAGFPARAPVPTPGLPVETAPWFGAACRPRFDGTYPFQGLEGCYPYGPDPGCRDYVLPFDSGADIPAGTTGVEIQTSPQTPFVGKRLIIGSTIAPSFIIEDLKVGKNSQFSATGGVSAEAFSEVGVGVALMVDPAYPGLDITLVVSNVGDDDLRFLATFIGNSVE